MFSQSGGLRVVKQHLSYLDSVQVRKVEDPWIHQVHRVWRVRVCVDSRQPLHAPDEFAIGGRIVGTPSSSKAPFPALEIRTLEISQRLVTGRKRSTSFGRPYTRIHYARVVVFRFRI